MKISCVVSISATLFISGILLLYKIGTHTHQIASIPNPVKFDTFIHNVTSKQYDATGRLSRWLQATTIQHTQNDMQYSKIKLNLYKDQRMIWQISADHGISPNSMATLDLKNHVMIRQPGLYPYPDTMIMMKTITIFPNQSRAETNDLITLLRGSLVLHAKGLRANFEKEPNITLLSQINAQFQHNTIKPYGK